MLGLAAIAVCGLSLILNIVGLAIPFWLYVSQSGQTSKIGLWQVCFTGSGCSSFVTASDALKATRAMEILGMIVLLVAVVCAVLKLLVMKDQKALPKIAGASAIAAGVLIIIGCIIFAAKVKEEFDQIFDFDLHAGFALCIISGVGGIASGVMFLVNKED